LFRAQRHQPGSSWRRHCRPIDRVQHGLRAGLCSGGPFGGYSDLRQPEPEMSRPGRVRKLAAILLVGCLASSVLLLRQLDRLRTGATLHEFLYISSPKLVKRLSLGYEGLLADIYWTRAVQYYGG